LKIAFYLLKIHNAVNVTFGPSETELEFFKKDLRFELRGYKSIIRMIDLLKMANQIYL